MSPRSALVLAAAIGVEAERIEPSLVRLVEARSAAARFDVTPWPAGESVVEEEMMSMQREGGCARGEVRYRLTSDPLFVHCCHCLNCQRQTGSAFVVNLLIETDRVEPLAGDPVPVDVPREAGSSGSSAPTCQIAVFSRYTSARIRFVRGGTLDEPSTVEPDVHIYTRSKLPWVTLPDGVPAFRTYYDTKRVWPGASLERLKVVTTRRGSRS